MPLARRRRAMEIANWVLYDIVLSLNFFTLSFAQCTDSLWNGSGVAGSWGTGYTSEGPRPTDRTGSTIAKPRSVNEGPGLPVQDHNLPMRYPGLPMRDCGCLLSVPLYRNLGNSLPLIWSCGPLVHEGLTTIDASYPSDTPFLRMAPCPFIVPTSVYFFESTSPQ